MGTNYYLHNKKPCHACGHFEEPLHIGKSSAGWNFSLHVMPDKRINNLDDWKLRLIDGEIKDEFNTVIICDDMLDIITKRHGKINRDERPMGYISWDLFHKANDSEMGDNELLRHKIDGRHCIGHGDGAYDYMIGEFS